MTTSTLGKIFNVFPQSLFLVGSDGTVATPDVDGDFDTYDLTPDVEWNVNGDSSKPSTSSFLQVNQPGRNSPYAYQQSEPSSSSNAKPSKGKWRPLSLSRNKPPGVAKQELAHTGQSMKTRKGVGETWTKTIEVCSYEDNSIKKLSIYPYKTASVGGVSEIVSTEAFNGEEVVLIDNDNLKIPNSARTRGKCNTDLV